MLPASRGTHGCDTVFRTSSTRLRTSRTTAAASVQPTPSRSPQTSANAATRPYQRLTILPIHLSRTKAEGCAPRAGWWYSRYVMAARSGGDGKELEDLVATI